MRKATNKFLCALLSAAMIVPSMAVYVQADTLDDVVIVEESEVVSEEVVGDSEDSIVYEIEEVSEEAVIIEADDEEIEEVVEEQQVEDVEVEEESEEALDLSVETDEEAEDGAISYITVDYDKVTHTLSIGGTGEMIAEDVDAIKDEITSSGETIADVKTIKIGRTVESIYANSFANFTSVDKVEFIEEADGASSIKSIGVSAFDGCTSLEEIVIPKNVTKIGNRAFFGCSKLAKLTISNDIPKSTLTIGNNAFEATAIKELTLPEGVKSIGSRAFANITQVKEDPADPDKSLEKAFIEDGITAIGSYAFAENADFVYVQIPNSLTSIGELAFNECPQLTTTGGLSSDNSAKYNVEYGNTVVKSCSWFKNFPYLVTINVPASVKTIPANAFGDEAKTVVTSVILETGITSVAAEAFSGYTALKTISFPETLKSIGNEAFYNCTSLVDINLAKVTTLGTYVFQNCTDLKKAIVQENTITAIPEGTFKGCTSLERVVLPATIKSIGKEAFSHCEKLVSDKNDQIVLTNVTSIGVSAFEECDTITYIKLENGLRTISNRTFAECDALKEVYIPQTVTSIGSKAFLNCSSLDNLEMYYYVTTISDDAFTGCSGLTSAGKRTTGSLLYTINYHFDKTVNKGVFDKFSDLDTVVIPDTDVTAIGDSAFKNCLALTSVTIGGSVKSIGNSAFEGCENLAGLSIPASVETIGNSAFKNSKVAKVGAAVNTVAIPVGIKSIGANAFENCPIVKLVIPSDSKLSSIGAEAFMGCKIDTSKNDPDKDGVKKLIIPNSLTTIGARAFKNNGSELLNISIGPNVTVMGDDIFSGCPTDLTLYGYKNTTAEAYANRYSIDFRYNSVKYHIDFNANGGTGTTNIMNNLYSNNEYVLNPNGFTKSGYIFKCWNTKADGTGKSYANKAKVMNLTTAEDETVTLFAIWQPAKYNITYVLNGAANNGGNPSVYYTTGASITLKNPARKGYTFGGWFSDKALTKQVKIIKQGTTGNITLYAKWTVNSYKIKFNKNGAKSGSMSAMTCKYDKAYKLKKNTFKRTGYTFNGWNTKKNGSGKTYKNLASVKNLTATNGATITLYAQWKPVTYKITYKLDGGTNNKSNPTKYNVTTKTITLKAPTQEGYEFLGWYSDKNFKHKVTKIPKGSTGNITLYAKWDIDYLYWYHIYGLL